MDQRNQLIEEIKQIAIQYRLEVGSARKPWPSSIRNRIEELIVLGLTPKQAAEATGVPYFSILHWRSQRRKNFHEIEVSKGKPVAVLQIPATVAVAGGVPTTISAGVLPSPALPIATVTVTTPDGFTIKVDGLDVAIELCRRLRNQSNEAKGRR